MRAIGDPGCDHPARVTDDDEARRAFDAVTTGYYRDPQPDQAAQALRVVCAMLDVAPDEQLKRFAPLIYLFGRIARLSDAGHAAIAPITAAYRGSHAPLIAIIGDRTAPFPDALTMPLVDPTHVDLQWAELFATGARAPLDRLVGVLDGPDRVRAHLERWLAEKRWFGGSKRRARADVLAALGLAIDLDARAIRHDGDLDLWAWRAAEARTPVFPALELEGDDLIALSLKGAALWSLRLNARDHALVAEVCRTAADAPGGPARRLLRDAVAADAAPFAL